MTEPTIEPENDPADTTSGDRDPLSTDDGLTAAGEGMPEVPDREQAPGEDGQDIEDRPLLDNPGLDVTDDGTDPTADEGD